MVVDGLLTASDFAVAIEVNVLHVARTEYECAALQVALIVGVGIFLLVDSLTCALAALYNLGHDVAVAVVYEVFLLIEAIYLEAPDFAVYLAGIVAAEGVNVAVVVDDGLEIAQGSGGVEVDFAKAVVVVKGDFPTVGVEVAIVAIEARCTIGERDILVGHDHVLGLAAIPVEACAEFAVEEASVNTDVKCGDVLPGNVACH